MNDKIFIPNYSSSAFPCVVVQNATTIRAYQEMPYNPSGTTTVSIPYRDFYYTSNYTFTDNFQTFSRTSKLPSCLAVNNLTSDFYYRNDMPNILLMFLIIFIFAIYFPTKVFSRLFKKGGL